MPNKTSFSSTIVVKPRRLFEISYNTLFMGVSGATLGNSVPVCITCFTCNNKRLPKAPAGCERAKSSAVKPRASSNATASASPSAKVAVVLEVGAKPSGQAS